MEHRITVVDNHYTVEDHPYDRTYGQYDLMCSCGINLGPAYSNEGINKKVEDHRQQMINAALGLSFTILSAVKG